MFTKIAFYSAAFAVIAGTSILASDSLAQGKGKTKPPTTKPTLGTVQMPGDSGKVGTIYQLGQKGSEFHFTLDSAAAAMRYGTREENIIAGKDQRLLVLSYTVHNPQKVEQRVDLHSFKFTVVSPDDKNTEFMGYIYDPVNRTKINQVLKPAQKVKLVAVIPIFAQGPVTKLIVARGQGAVLRYDLREGMVKGNSVFMPDGISANDDAAVELNKPFDFAGFDVEIQEIAESMEPIGSYKPTANTGLYYATVKFSNPLLLPLSIGWQYFAPALTDENGEKVNWPSDLVSMSSGTTFRQQLDADSSVRARYVFTGAKGLKLAKLKLTHNGSSRSISVKLP